MSEIRYINPRVNEDGNSITINLKRFTDGGTPEAFADTPVFIDTGTISISQNPDTDLSTDNSESLSVSSASIDVIVLGFGPNTIELNLVLNRTVFSNETITFSVDQDIIQDDPLDPAGSVQVIGASVTNNSEVAPPVISSSVTALSKPFGPNAKSNTTIFRSTVRNENTFISANITPEPEYVDWEIRLKSGRDPDNPVQSKFRIFNTRKISPNIDTIEAESATSFSIPLNRQNTFQFRFKPKGGSFSEWTDIILNSDIRILGARHFDRYKLTREKGTTKTEHLNPQFNAKRKNGISIIKQIFSAKGRKRSI